MNNNNTELFWSSRKHIQLVLFYDWGSQGQITEVLCWQTCGNAGSESRCLEYHHPRPLPTASQLWHFLIVCLLGEVFHTSLGNQWYEVLSVASTETQVCLSEQFIGRCFVAWTVCTPLELSPGCAVQSRQCWDFPSCWRILWRSRACAFLSWSG